MRSCSTKRIHIMTANPLLPSNLHSLYMKLTTSILSICLLAMSNLCVANPCLGKDPIAATRKFIGAHYAFYAENPIDIQAIVTPRLFKILKTERRCAREEVCALDGDPWLDAQDGKMGKKIDYATERESATDAVVDIRYDFILSPADPVEKREAKLVLQRSAAGQCWLVADLVSPGGESLLHLLETWHADNRAGSHK